MADTMWVFRRGGSVRWTASWCPDPSNPAKRRQATLPAQIKTERQAQAYANEHADELRARPVGSSRRAAPSAPDGKTIAELSDPFIALRTADERLAGSTVQDDASHMRCHIVKDLGSKRPDDLDVPTLRAWVRKKRDQKAPNTVYNIYNTLVAFLDACIGEHWMKGLINLARAEMVRAELPEKRPLVGRSQKLRIGLDVAQQLISSPLVPPDRRVRDLVDFVTGCRNGELSGCRRGDVHLKATIPAISIRRALQLKSRQGHAKIGPTKTLDSVRDMPLPPAGVEALQWWLDAGWERYTGIVPTDDAPLFPNRDGQFWRPKSAKHARKDLQRIGAPTHVDGHALTFNALRRSFINFLSAAGVPEDVRVRLMGHVPRSVGERHYNETDLAILAEAVAKIPLVWTPVCESDWTSCVKPRARSNRGPLPAQGLENEAI